MAPMESMEGSKEFPGIDKSVNRITGLNRIK